MPTSILSSSSEAEMDNFGRNTPSVFRHVLLVFLGNELCSYTF